MGVPKIVVIDEHGVEHEFDIVDVFELEHTYVFISRKVDEEEEEVYIARWEGDHLALVRDYNELMPIFIEIERIVLEEGEDFGELML
jgi:uncharacterized protein YrzB (UPF0473 family)